MRQAITGHHPQLRMCPQLIVGELGDCLLDQLAAITGGVMLPIVAHAADSRISALDSTSALLEALHRFIANGKAPSIKPINDCQWRSFSVDDVLIKHRHIPKILPPG